MGKKILVNTRKITIPTIRTTMKKTIIQFITTSFLFNLSIVNATLIIDKVRAYYQIVDRFFPKNWYRDSHMGRFFPKSILKVIKQYSRLIYGTIYCNYAGLRSICIARKLTSFVIGRRLS